MEQATSLSYQREEYGLLWIQIITDRGNYEINGFESEFLTYVDRVLDSEFEDNELYFRDQPYQKLIMDKTGEGMLQLSLIHPDSDPEGSEIEVEKERFRKFLEDIKDSISD